MEIVPIKTKRDYRRTLKEIEGLMTAKRNTPEGDRLDVLVTLLGAALLEQAVLVPSNARWISLTMGAAKAFWGWVVGWGRTI